MWTLLPISNYLILVGAEDDKGDSFTLKHLKQFKNNKIIL